MSLLDNLAKEEMWEKFYEYKLSLACPKDFSQELRNFIDEKIYLKFSDSIAHREAFPLPRKSVISKMSTDKKRIVYSYPKEESTVLKFLTWMMLRRYDDIFSKGLYSFRPGRTAKNAVRYLLKNPDLSYMYAYKVDIHNYFNSIPVDRLLLILEKVLGNDPELFLFLSYLLTESRVMDRGQIIREEKGIMAGTPQSAFYANLYLMEMDRYFADHNVIYVRYSDDIIVMAKSKEELERHVKYIQDYLNDKGLSVNPAKENYYLPQEGFLFLGFYFDGKVVDIAPATLQKLKKKMHRKRDSLMRWSKRNKVDSIKAAKAFIRIFNGKLLESSKDNELCWANWFFPVINTSDSLHVIDRYAQDCIRIIISGKRTKSRYNVRYEDLKKLGYRSLVHEYYMSLKIKEND